MFPPSNPAAREPRARPGRPRDQIALASESAGSGAIVLARRDPFPNATRSRPPPNPAPLAHCAPSSSRILPPFIAQTLRRGSSAVTRAAAKAKAPKPGVDGVPYVATNRFVIPDGDAEVVKRFVLEIESREALMKTLPGFTSCALTSGPGAGEYTFTQEWETKVAYEDFMNHPKRRRSHMAPGVYQYLPKDKWSVPENFTPILPEKK